MGTNMSGVEAFYLVKSSNGRTEPVLGAIETTRRKASDSKGEPRLGSHACGLGGL